MKTLWLDNLNRLVRYNDGRLKDCECETCEQFIYRIVTECEQRRYYHVRKTGYLYHLTDTTKPLAKSMLHWITRTVENGAYVYRLNSIDCACQRQIVAETRGVAVSSVADFGYGFFASADACAGRCEDEVAILVAQAVNNGWTILGGGVLAKRTSAQYSCCRFDHAPIAVSLCVDTGTSYIYIGCDCTSGQKVSDYALWTYLEYDACECLDIRELILSYPDEFGVEDVSFGDDTVYTLDKSQSGGSVHTTSCLERSTSYDTWFCNYRSMYVIFDNSCVGRQNDNGFGSYTPDYFLMKFDTDGRWLGGDSYPLKYDDVTNGTLTFDGKIQPFTTSEHNKEIWPHSDLMNWKGLTIRWIARNSNNYWGGGGAYDSYYSQSDAQAELERLNNRPNKYGYNSFEAVTTNRTYFYEPKTSVTPPNFNPTHVEGRVEYNQNTGMWDVYAPHDEFGSDNIVYNLNFAETNKGFLINGQNGFHDTLGVYGFLDSITHWTTPPAEQTIIDEYQNVLTRCYDSEQGMDSMCPEGSEKIVGRNGAFEAIMSIPMYDMAFVVTPDESMGGCQPKGWWDAIMEEYEDEEEEPEAV